MSGGKASAAPQAPAAGAKGAPGGAGTDKHPAAGGGSRGKAPAPAGNGAAALPKLKIRYELTDKLVPYARNARTHKPADVAAIAGSIREFGFTNPVLLDGNRGILAGHGRVLAAQMLELKRVPTIDLAHLNDAQRRAYVLADNQLATKAGWDNELLCVELGELKEIGYDVGLTGFTESEVRGFFTRANRTEGLTGEDDAPPAGSAPITRRGDIWVCGAHHIACGDATNKTDVGRVLANAAPNLMVTDPPYGISYNADWRNHAKCKLGNKIGGSAVGKVSNDHISDWRDAWILFPGNVAYCWSPPHADQFKHADALVAAGFDVRAQIIWAKNQMVIGRGHYHGQHEPCLYAVRKGGKGNWHGGRKQTTLWQIDKPVKSETGHSTQKPVECMRRPIENNSAPGDPVYDPFLGSGTTVIAAETCGRVCLGLEIEPAYVDMAVQRWQDFTGGTATLDGDGRTFEDIGRARAAEAGAAANETTERPAPGSAGG